MSSNLRHLSPLVFRLDWSGGCCHFLDQFFLRLTSTAIAFRVIVFTRSADQRLRSSEVDHHISLLFLGSHLALLVERETVFLRRG